MSRSKRVPRIYFPGEIAAHGLIDLPPEQSHHVAHVLRLTAGDALVAFDGRGNEYNAVVERLSKSVVTMSMGNAKAVDRESSLEVTLVQGISSGERMDYTIQKAVELGVYAIQPVMMERSIVRLDSERAAKRVAHWRSIAIAACEQCGRNRVPQIHPVASFAPWLASPKADALCLTLAPDASLRLIEMGGVTRPVMLLVGPEGGLAATERADALAAGFVAVRMGPRVLRTETAAVAALAALQTLWGDF